MELKAVLLWIILDSLKLVLTFSTEDCPASVRHDNHTFVHDTSCYYFVTNQAKDHQTAETTCRTLGGGLAVIDNHSTQRFVDDILKYHFSVQGQVWFGLRNIGSAGAYLMPNGATPKYTNWAPNEPALTELKNGCAVVDMQQTGQWKVFQCDKGPFFVNEVHSFICEFPNANHDSTTAALTTTTTGHISTTHPIPLTTTAVHVPVTTPKPCEDTLTNPPCITLYPDICSTPSSAYVLCRRSCGMCP